MQLEGFDVTGVLGQGARSSVFAARCLADGRLYAVKQLIRRPGDDGRYLEQIAREHAVASRLDHPGLRKTHRLIRRRSLLRVVEMLLVMEHVEGRTLAAAGRLEPAALLPPMIGAARALEAMHRAGFVHADLKPENILLSAAGQAKLIDFGQSCPSGAVKRRIQGTPAFLAPEQIERAPLDVRTDVFNLGGTLFWCLTGRNLPADAQGRMGLATDAAPAPFEPRTYNPRVPLALSNLVVECVRRERARRPASVAEVRRRLELAADRLVAPMPSGGARPVEAGEAQAIGEGSKRVPVAVVNGMEG